MKQKKSLRFLALFLTLLLLVTALPLSVFAEGISIEGKSEDFAQVDAALSSNTEGVAIEPEGYEKIKPFLREVTELRGEFVKHFDNGDGTYEAITYGSAVHRKDADGKWQDIDNTLSLRGEKDKERFTTSDGRIFFSDTLEKDGVVWSLSENGYDVSLSFADAGLRSNVRADVKNHASRAEQLAAAEKADDRDAVIRVDNRTTILYRDVAPGIDIEYALYANDIKESILVNAPGEKYEYAFKLALSGLVAKLTDAGSIMLCDVKDGEIVYSIPAPYMFDEKGDYSEDVWYTLTSVEDGVYTLVVSASPEWINDPERAFPVAIDPTFTETSGTCDTYFSCYTEAHKDINYGGSSIMWLSNVEIPFIKSTSMPQLPNGATVTNAKLFVSYYYYSGVTGSMTVSAHRANLSWSEYVDTWNTMSRNGLVTTLGLSPSVLDTANMYTASSYPQWAEFNITSAAQHWYNGRTTASNSNYGIGLKRVSGNGSVILHTRDAGNGYAAYFSISYRPINGIYSLLNYDANCFLKSGSPLLSGQTIYYPTERDSIFKFAYRAATDDFVIRSMVDNSLIVYHNASLIKPMAESVTVNGTQVSDDNLSTAYTWKIGVHPDYPDGSRFAIWNVCGSQNYYLTAEETYYGYSINVTTNVSAPGTGWCFLDERDYSGQGVESHTLDPQFMIPGETIHLDYFMYDYRIGVNGPVTYSVTDANGNATNLATINVEDGTCTANAVGTFYLHITYPSGPSIDPIVIKVEPSLEGVYYFQNREFTSYYLQIDDGVDPNYNTAGSIMEIWTYNSSYIHRWSLSYVGNGHYTIISLANNLAITVQPGQEHASAKDLVLQPYPYSVDGVDKSNNQKWRITPTPNNAYKICALSSDSVPGNELVMDLEAPSWIQLHITHKYGGLNIRQDHYVDNSSYRDEWCLKPFVINLYGIDAVGHDHFNALNNSAYYLFSTKYVSNLKTGAFSGTDCKNDLINSNLFAIRCHGNCYLFPTNPETTFVQLNSDTNYLYSHYGHSVPVLPLSPDSAVIEDTDNCSKLEIALFIACYTGAGGVDGNNLPNKAVSCGAKCAIGFIGSVNCDAANIWTEWFFACLLSGLTFEQAATFASSQLPETSGVSLSQLVICGNSSGKSGRLCFVSDS